MSTTEMLRVVGLVAATVLAAALLAAVRPVPASAEPAQQFSMQLSATRADGPVAFRIRLRSYDTTGLVPPAPTAYFIRMPRGAAIRRPFLTRRYDCDGLALRLALDKRPSGVPFVRRVADLRPFIRSLARTRSRAARSALANARTCQRARLGGGTGLIDARDAIPVLDEPIPFGFQAFLTRSRSRGAVAGIVALGAADERSPIVRRYPVVAGVHAAIGMDLVDDPTPDGLYGLKLLLPTGPIAGFDVRMAEIDAHVRSLRLRRGTCLARARGRCARRQDADVHAFAIPACPPSGHLSALAFTGYAPPIPSLTTAFELPCPRFLR